jgi:hypothetical protein
MGCKTKPLIEIRRVVDHDTGEYRMGEIHCFVDDIDVYLRRYGDRGFYDLLEALARFQGEVMETYTTIRRERLKERDANAEAVPQRDPEGA